MQKLGPLSIDETARVAVIDGHAAVRLTRKETGVLLYLAQHVGKPIEHRALVAAVWGVGALNRQSVTERVTVSRLRLKMQLDGTHGLTLTSVYGVGYRLDVDSEAKR